MLRQHIIQDTAQLSLRQPHIWEAEEKGDGEVSTSSRLPST